MNEVMDRFKGTSVATAVSTWLKVNLKDPLSVFVICLLGKYPFYTNKCPFFCVLQSKVKNLCAAYKYLLKTHRDGFLRVLACDHAVDHQMVCKAAKSLVYVEVRFYITLC
jgi:hypothetical protein